VTVSPISSPTLHAGRVSVPFSSRLEPWALVYARVALGAAFALYPIQRSGTSR
jgi:hypothetical protein